MSLIRETRQSAAMHEMIHIGSGLLRPVGIERAAMDLARRPPSRACCTATQVGLWKYGAVGVLYVFVRPFWTGVTISLAMALFRQFWRFFCMLKNPEAFLF